MDLGAGGRGFKSRLPDRIVDGIQRAAGKHRPRQLGTYASQRAALIAARARRADDRSTERGARFSTWSRPGSRQM
jgi:hypothetical protein